ncbi:AraC family transcriptional regulator [Bacillus paranthracis]|uniref:helix-turn-helix transcriptional regulator n=2 Tax=Bacillus paranthracis TaxID=2026186 RepID=UPI00211A04E1|nr:AraC family transcriptional regulator [Bacillus paranthracis]MCR6799287.1 AraC family transcriptional regulator [Bacillus paranthracis]MEC3358554.1 AraC family transcriptional regulator [Bacillus paranthracis]MED0785549.1 AraC family transcriptional regulator [Bacillus paranthracis]MED0809159.1 AraC family transcriptional regulator [Bacillus paranthracis]MED0817216.1 AraC family transcriptional regulator [Bacillus paranthracis]
MDNNKILIERSTGVLLSTNKKKDESIWRYDNCYKMIFSINGTMNYQMKKNDLNLSKEQFMILNPNEEHKQLAAENHKFLIELDPLFLNDIAKSINVYNYDIQFANAIQKNPQITQWVLFVSEYLCNERIDSSVEFFIDHSLAQLAILLIKNTAGIHTNTLNISSFNTISPLIHKTMKGMMEHYQHQWTLDEMSSIAHLSKYQFAHLFKEITGMSPYSWLQMYRIIRSQEDLKNTNNTILEIALDCGFSSVSVYNQLFKRLYGETPGSFRKKLKK